MSKKCPNCGRDLEKTDVTGQQSVQNYCDCEQDEGSVDGGAHYDEENSGAYYG